MGCYSENSTGRSLAWRQDQVSSASLTIETCLLACKKEGYSFAGVEFGQECYCGVVLGNGTLALPDGSCTFLCTGNVNETVGEHSEGGLSHEQICLLPRYRVYLLMRHVSTPTSVLKKQLLTL
jgi:hypothetical protein